MSSGSDRGSVRSEINATPLIDVLLVLLIIFLVVMPVMMKMETLEVPPPIADGAIPDNPEPALVVGVMASGDVSIEQDGAQRVIAGDQLLSAVRPRVDAMREKVVFVKFESAVAWADVVQTMDTIRSMATDVNRDEVKVALKLREEAPAAIP